jgi:hypothetical protein
VQPHVPSARTKHRGKAPAGLQQASAPLVPHSVVYPAWHTHAPVDAAHVRPVPVQPAELQQYPPLHRPLRHRLLKVQAAPAANLGEQVPGELQYSVLLLQHLLIPLE